MVYYRLDKDSQPDDYSYISMSGQGIFATQQELVTWIYNSHHFDDQEIEYLRLHMIQTDRGWCVKTDGLFGVPAQGYIQDDAMWFCEYVLSGEIIEPVHYLQIWEGQPLDDISFVDGELFKPIRIIKTIPLQDIQLVMRSIYETVGNKREAISVLMTLLEELTVKNEDEVLEREKRIYNILALKQGLRYYYNSNKLQARNSIDTDYDFIADQLQIPVSDVATYYTYLNDLYKKGVKLYTLGTVLATNLGIDLSLAHKFTGLWMRKFNPDKVENTIEWARRTQNP